MRQLRHLLPFGGCAVPGQAPYPPVPRILRQRPGRLPARQSGPAGRQARRQGLLAGCGKERLCLRKRCPHRPSRRRNPLRHQGYAERRRQGACRPARWRPSPSSACCPQAAFRLGRSTNRLLHRPAASGAPLLPPDAAGSSASWNPVTRNPLAPALHRLKNPPGTKKIL